MANQYYDRDSERYGRRSYEENDPNRRWGREDRRGERGTFEQAGDEVRSWFGDDDAEQRRRNDQGRYGQDNYENESERLNTRGGYGRENDYSRGYSNRSSDYDRSGISARGSERGAGYGYSRRGYENERYGNDTEFGNRSYHSGRYTGGGTWSNRGYESGLYGSNYPGQSYGNYGASEYGGGTESGSYGSMSTQGYNSSGVEQQGYNYGNQGSNWNQGGLSANQAETGQSRWGQYSGRGPQGYQRSDQRIEEDVNEHLTHHGGVDASNIQVTVKDGEVTLSGSVNSRFEKRVAEDVAEACSGVKEVHNQLRVQQQWQNQSSLQGNSSGNINSTTASDAQSQKRAAGR